MFEGLKRLDPNIQSIRPTAVWNKCSTFIHLYIALLTDPIFKGFTTNFSLFKGQHVVTIRGSHNVLFSFSF